MDVFYMTCGSEEKARREALTFCLNHKYVRPDIASYGESLAYHKLLLESWEYPVVLVPKSCFGHIVPPGVDYDDSRDTLYGNYTEFPCVEVMDPDGNPAAYFAFESGPDACLCCERFASAEHEDCYQGRYEGCKPIPVCPYLGGYLGLHVGDCKLRIPTKWKTQRQQVEEFWNMANKNKSL